MGRIERSPVSEAKNSAELPQEVWEEGVGDRVMLKGSMTLDRGREQLLRVLNTILTLASCCRSPMVQLNAKPKDGANSDTIDILLKQCWEVKKYN